MSAEATDAAHPPEPPHARLRARLEAQADALERAGAAGAAEAVRAAAREVWREMEGWNARVCDVLGVHHEINNALVGVRGNAQLLLMNAAAQAPGVRERLEVVLRESGRIQEAAVRLGDLKRALGGGVSRSRAA